MEMEEKIELSKVSFKSNTPGTYNKDFGKAKDSLRQQGFPEEETKALIESLLNEKTLAKFEKNIPKDAVLLSMPIKADSKTSNIIPKVFAELLAQKTDRSTIDLSQYMKVRQQATARLSHSAEKRSENFFNISFKDNESKIALESKLKNKEPVLIDDVLTTGETMVAMATYLNVELEKAAIDKGHTLAAVDNRTPTPRDIYRLSEKLYDNLPPGQDRIAIANNVDEALTNYTRKKLQRFEQYANTPKGAIEQYDNIHKDIEKMQRSLKESFSGNLFRYPLDKVELQNLKQTPTNDIPQSIKERAIMDFFPNASISESKDGSMRIFENATLEKEISSNNKPNSDINMMVDNAIDFIKAQSLEQRIERNNISM